MEEGSEACADEERQGEPASAEESEGCSPETTMVGERAEASTEDEPSEGGEDSAQGEERCSACAGTGGRPQDVGAVHSGPQQDDQDSTRRQGDGGQGDPVMQ